MAVLLICGSGRGAGKTAVGCALITAMLDVHWIGVKATPHSHDFAEGLWEETDRNSKKDTGRYLAAGAVRAFLACSSSGDAAAWWAEAMQVVPQGASLLIETNQADPRIAAIRSEPVVCVAVLAGNQAGWKPSLHARIACADALVVAEGLNRDELSPELQQKPTFFLPEGLWSSPELLEFVRKRLSV